MTGDLCWRCAMPRKGRWNGYESASVADMLRRQRLDLSTIHYQFSIISSVAVLELGLLTASRHLLRGRDLLGGHFGCNFIAPLDRHISCIAVRCCRREGKPRVRAHEILPHACAVGIHYSEIHLRRRVSLHCREAIPFYGFLIIPRYALASLVRQTETELRRCGSLRRREAIPLHGFLIILRHAFPFCVYRTQSHLRPIVFPRRRDAIPLHGFLIILRHALAFLIRQTQIILRRDISLPGREAIPLHGFLIILRHAFPLCVHQSHPSLVPLVSVLGKLAKEFHRLNVVAPFVRGAGIVKRVWRRKTSGTEQTKNREQKQSGLHGAPHGIAYGLPEHDCCASPPSTVDRESVNHLSGARTAKPKFITPTFPIGSAGSADIPTQTPPVSCSELTCRCKPFGF